MSRRLALALTGVSLITAAGCRGQAESAAHQDDAGITLPSPHDDDRSTPQPSVAPAPTDTTDAATDAEAETEAGGTGYVPTPEEIDAMLADPKLHRGMIPEEAMRLPPPPKETLPEPPRTNPQRRKLGMAILEALGAKDRDALLALTPIGSETLKAECPGVEIDQRALEARLAHCFEGFEWQEIEDATVNGGAPTARPIEGCVDGIRAFERVRVQVKTASGRHDAELRDAFGREDQILGFLGTVTCVQR